MKSCNMSSEEDDPNAGKVCSSCFNILLIFDFCLECDLEWVKCSCEEKFSSFQDFKDHLVPDKHSGVTVQGEIKLQQLTDTRQVFVCIICKSLFEDRKRVTIHLRSVHRTSKSYSCWECSRTYQTKGSLLCHIQTHLQQPSYVCDICKKSYFKFAHLKYHILSHLNAKSFVCNLCDKAFNDKYLLRRHIKQHSTEKLFKCDQCEKIFTFNFTLKRHKLIHSQGDRFVCDICQKTYKWKLDLRRHILAHVEGKSFACTICKKSFSRKSYLVEHERSHSAAKMHMCFCGKMFKFLSGLSKHRASHNKCVNVKTGKRNDTSGTLA